jgi:hypothetical protein
MDSLVSAAARALAIGDPLGALKLIALRDDPPALALRGISMAQLGDFVQARKLLGRAARAFGAGEPVARARCVTALAEIALVSRDLSTDQAELEAAADVLGAHGDLANALFARLVTIRRLVLLGRVHEAERMLAELELGSVPPRLVAVAELVRADVATRQLRVESARQSLARAGQAAFAARIPMLASEVERALQGLEAPAARLVAGQEQRVLRLGEVETLLRSGKLVVDACRREVRAGKTAKSLVSRPVLFALLESLGARAPSEVSRTDLIREAFGARQPNPSHRARLRVEIGRLRRSLGKLAEIRATENGFALVPPDGKAVCLLAPPAAGEASALLALLHGGEAWSTSGLATALGKSQRTVQRALIGLVDKGTVLAIGKGRAQRWIAKPNTSFATTLLLVARDALG